MIKISWITIRKSGGKCEIKNETHHWTIIKKSSTEWMKEIRDSIVSWKKSKIILYHKKIGDSIVWTKDIGDIIVWMKDDGDSAEFTNEIRDSIAS